MRELWPFIRLMRAEKAYLLLALGLALLTLLAGVGLLSLAGYLISAAAFAGLNLATAWSFNYLLPAAGVRFFALTRIAARYGERVTSHDATLNLLARLRIWFYQKLEPIAPAHLFEHRSADLLNRAIHDIDALDNLYIRVFAPFFSALLLTALMGVFLAFFNAVIALLTGFLMGASLILIPLLLLQLGKKTGEAMIQETARLRIHFIALKQNLSDLLLFRAEAVQAAAIDASQQRLIRLQKRMSQLKGLSLALVSGVCGVTLWLALFYGIKLVHHHQLNGANLALMILAILAAFEAITPLPVAFQYLGKTREAARRILAVTSQQAAVHFADEDVSPEDLSLRFKQVSFAYTHGGRNILENIDLRIAYGEKVAICGATGAGKTSLAQLLVRFRDPTKGAIFIGDCPLQHLTETQLRDLICLVPQQPHIFHQSIRDNLRIAKTEASEQELWNTLQSVSLATLVQSLPQGLDTQMGEFGRHFSGGQIKCFAIARAILKDAPIIILDEPTEGMDSVTQDTVLRQLAVIWREKTVIIITHQPALLKYADRVIRLQQGRITD